MRGQTLATLLPMLKAELGQSQDVSNVASDPSYKLLLANTQRWLASEYDWPFLTHRWDVAANASSRFLALPTVTSIIDDLALTASINFERPVTVETQWGTFWNPIEYGIGSEQFNALSSANPSNTSNPIRRWRMASDTSETTTADQFEIWPVPTVAQTVRFTGQRDLVTFASNNDKCDLDGMLLVFFCAAEIAAKDALPSAQFIATKAQERLKRLLGAYPIRQRDIILGQGRDYHNSEKKLLPVVVVA